VWCKLSALFPQRDTAEVAFLRATQAEAIQMKPFIGEANLSRKPWFLESGQFSLRKPDLPGKDSCSV
jgi:hypothetical protein